MNLIVAASDDGVVEIFPDSEDIHVYLLNICDIEEAETRIPELEDGMIEELHLNMSCADKVHALAVEEQLSEMREKEREVIKETARTVDLLQKNLQSGVISKEEMQSSIDNLWNNMSSLLDELDKEMEKIEDGEESRKKKRPQRKTS